MTEKTTTTKKTKKAAKAKVTKTRAAAPRAVDVVFRALGKRPQTVADLVTKTGLTDSKVRDALRSLGGSIGRAPLKVAQTAPSGRGRKVHEGYVKITADTVTAAAERVTEAAS